MSKRYELVCTVSPKGKCSIADRQIFEETVRWHEKRIEKLNKAIRLCKDHEVITLSNAEEAYGDFLLEQNHEVEAFKQYFNAYYSATATDEVFYVDEKLPDDTMSIFGHRRNWITYSCYSSKINAIIARLRGKCLEIAHRHPELMDFIEKMTFEI